MKRLVKAVAEASGGNKLWRSDAGIELIAAQAVAGVNQREAQIRLQAVVRQANIHLISGKKLPRSFQLRPIGQRALQTCRDVDGQEFGAGLRRIRQFEIESVLRRIEVGPDAAAVLAVGLLPCV